MNAIKILIAALAALLVLGGLVMADGSTRTSTVSLNVPSYISISVSSNVPLTNDPETHIAAGSDTLTISSTDSYYVQGAAPRLTTGTVTLTNGLKVSADAGALTDLYGTTTGGATQGVTPRDIENLGTSGSPLTPITTDTVSLAYTQDTQNIEQGAYTTTVTYTATLVP